MTQVRSLPLVAGTAIRHSTVCPSDVLAPYGRQHWVYRWLTYLLDSTEWSSGIPASKWQGSARSAGVSAL